MSETVSICRYRDIDLTPERVAEIDRIFFESSNTKTFPSDAARAAFRERWLGRYLVHDPAFAYLARDGGGRIIGYLVGAIDDPAKTPRFADIPYFAMLGAQTKRYPAHLHVNISPEFRNRGIGGRLISCFIVDAQAAGVPGVHVVTSVGAANVSFYNRNGFEEVARAGPDGSLVFLARSL
ncbi:MULTISPECIES: GNAT family N-acetyltransferase [unclassified Hyphomicrobium]|uniref:GNAT family N-acetyltransferase n=1 Tax=unclassified Hyphomicrobium TaxID=2619925 RepID=UPI000213D320|nr:MULTISPECIES: GNAT family N-acetyltransferase [unclassified Hyphomicrobium]CCB64318.1 GCN5-related N-acetyltransferase [Hyphomicrobium sp. MC1]